MAEIRKTFAGGRMNLDIDNRMLPSGEYREANNVLIGESEGSNEGVVEKSLSNRRLTNLTVGSNPIIIGEKAHEPRRRIYWLIKSDTGCYLAEWDHDTQSASFVIQDTRPLGERVFDLKENSLCTGIDIITSDDEQKEQILITDNNLQPLCFNISRAKTYGENGFEKEDIFLIKKPPRFCPTTQLTYTGGKENFIEKEFLSFSYRYKYLDGEYSALSDYTKYEFAPGEFELNYQSMENLGMVNKFNAVRISFNTGDKRVTDIQLIVKKSNSNALYIIETFNKSLENWGNDEQKSFLFSNNKNYQVLPLDELFRSFDNVPRAAKSQTVIGNRVVYGNYLEGYDLIDINGRKVKPEYSISIISDPVTGSALPIDITGSQSMGGQQITIDFSGVTLSSGNSIRFAFVMQSVYSGVIKYGSFDGSVDFILNQNYASAEELALDEDFISFITNVLTNAFIGGVNFEPPANGSLTNTPAFSFTYTSNTITITAPVFHYQIDNTPTNPDDSNFTERDYDWHFFSESSVSYRSFDVATSIKTNRSLEIGLLYEDDFNRKTIVITGSNNTIFIPQSLSTSRNRLQITLDSLPPAWADRYKIVVKQQPLTYQTIYGIKFYEDGLFRWLKIEGANLDKVNQGDTLIVKSDLGGPVFDVIKILVLEKVVKEKDFIEDNENVDGDPIIEEHGTYIKFIPQGIDMNYSTATARTFEGSSHLRYPVNTYTNPFFGDMDGTTFIPYKLGPGSNVHIYINFHARGSIEYDATYDKRFTVNSDYDSVEEWFNTEVQTLGSFGEDYTRDYGFNEDGKQFYVRAHRDGTASRNITTTVRFEILFTEGILILETEPKDTDIDVFYETAQAFEIINGYHQGNNQNQNSALPAIIDLDFFNCFTMGNGAESYRIKDTFNSNWLNIDLRPSTTSIEEYKAIRRIADQTYSEPYIESANINGLNEFNLSKGNYKELDKQKGSIQKMIARENDIVVLQEDGAGKVLFEKDAIYTAEGEGVITASQNVLGQYTPYQGNYGIGTHPESCSVDSAGRIKYISQRNGVVVRLSYDGIEEIIYGLKSFFRKLFMQQPNAKMLSSFDPYLDQTVFAVGNEPIRVPQFGCGTNISKYKQTDEFRYNLFLNNLGGDIVFSYDITEGSATITADFNGTTTVVSNVTGPGTITIPRNSLVESIVSITVTPVGGPISYTIINTCPLGTELKVVCVVLNDDSDTGQSMTDRFKWSGSSFYSTDELFTTAPLTRFETITGTEGIGPFPSNGSLVTIQAFKDTLNNGHFSTSECNRLGYLISDVVYNSGNFGLILTNPDTEFLTVTNSSSGDDVVTETSTSQFLFSRTDTDQILYLIWDYTSRNPILNDDTVSVNIGQSVIIDVLANDEISVGAIVSIVTQPESGTAVVNSDSTITYTHDASDILNDSFVYSVTENGCTSTATVSVSIGIGCGGSLTATGNVGIYTIDINLGSAVGWAGIFFNAQSVPDRAELFWDEVKVADTKYIGDGLDVGPPVSFSPTLLGVRDLDVFIYNGSPTSPYFDDTGVNETITVVQSDIADNITEPTDGNAYLTFNKTAPFPTTVRLRVTGTTGTGWNIMNVICPTSEDDLIEGSNKLVYGFFSEADKGIKDKSMGFFLGSSPVKFYTNMFGHTNFNDFGRTSTNSFINDGVTWWEISVDGTILNTGLL